uniref:Zona pellucida sperm-binding protein 4 n=1 Tax=Tetraodon nigroviridis TaxID=99883 RepID=H3CZT7_TETNG
KCNMEKPLRVDCGRPGIDDHECITLGCCYDVHDSACFYRLNGEIGAGLCETCSLDGHFVFSVEAADTEAAIDPSALLVKDQQQPHCSPVVTTRDTAVFKIGLKDCGSKMKPGRSSTFRSARTITVWESCWGALKRERSSPQRFSFVQCEYEASDLMRAANLRSWYAATTPAPVVALGSFRVLMRIAREENPNRACVVLDASFTSFFPEDQLPLSLPLRKAAYVEVAIAQPSPDPGLCLRVRDCFAYPASRHSVWTLLYDGCPNPLDNMRSSVPVDNQGRTASHSQVRRFDVKTFAFVDPHTGHPSMEEIYFYCWVEICTSDAACAQQCTIICECTALRRLFQDTDRVKHKWLSSPLDAFLCT